MDHLFFKKCCVKHSSYLKSYLRYRGSKSQWRGPSSEFLTNIPKWLWSKYTTPFMWMKIQVLSLLRSSSDTDQSPLLWFYIVFSKFWLSDSPTQYIRSYLLYGVEQICLFIWFWFKLWCEILFCLQKMICYWREVLT